MCICPNISIK
jgi:membrane associated rhomboid family serine protease